MQKRNLVALAMALTFGITGLAKGAIVINEIDSDSANTPTTDFAEFIELYSTTGTTTDLSGLVLVLFNGNGNVSYKSIDLDGFSTNSSGYFVFGSTAIAGANDTTLLGAGNILQNGDDAVALLVGDATSFPNGTGVGTVVPANIVDAIVYDTNDADNPTLMAALGQSVQYDEFGGTADGNFGASHSLARIPNGTGPFTSQLPTPGALNVVPEPASVGLIGAAGLLLAGARRRAAK